MNNFIGGLQDTSKCLIEQGKLLDSSLEALLNSDNKLRSFLLLKMIVAKSNIALGSLIIDIPDIEKRLLSETEEICCQAEDVVKGVKIHSDWCKDIIDAIGKLCQDSGLETRQIEIHQLIDEMEISLQKLIEHRNAMPLEQLDK